MNPTYTGTAEDVMALILGDLEKALGDGWVSEIYFNQGMDGLVGLYDRVAAAGPPDPEKLRAFRAQSAELLERLAQHTAAFAIDTLGHAEGADDDHWALLSMKRSAIQSLLDDYPGTGVPALIEAEDVQELDEYLREIAPDQTPVPEQDMPRGLPDSHWWWRPTPATAGHMSERRLVVLKHGPYEGLERPPLGDEVPEETRARAHALEAATDIAGLRRLLIGLARDGIDGYDLVGLGGFGGSAWDFLGFDVVSDGQSALRHRDEAQTPEWSDRLNEHGLFWSREEAEAFRQAVAAAETVPVQRVRRSAIRPGDRIWYTIGNEHNPGDAFGRIVLTIDDDGSAVLEFYDRSPGGKTWTGRVDPSVVGRIRSALTAAAFPAMPMDPVPAGSTMRQLEVITDDEPQYAQLTDDQGASLDGYSEAFAMLDSLAIQLSGGVYQRGRDTLEPSVSDVRPTRPA